MSDKEESRGARRMYMGKDGVVRPAEEVLKRAFDVEEVRKALETAVYQQQDRAVARFEAFERLIGSGRVKVGMTPNDLGILWGETAQVTTPAAKAPVNADEPRLDPDCTCGLDGYGRPCFTADANRKAQKEMVAAFNERERLGQAPKGPPFGPCCYVCVELGHPCAKSREDAAESNEKPEPPRNYAVVRPGLKCTKWDKPGMCQSIMGGEGCPCDNGAQRKWVGVQMERERLGLDARTGRTPRAVAAPAPGAVDEQGRVPVPPAMREELGSGVVWFLRGKERWEAWSEVDLGSMLAGNEGKPEAEADTAWSESAQSILAGGQTRGPRRQAPLGSAEKAFTRAEVLAVLRARKDSGSPFIQPGLELDALIGIFERMG